MAVNSSNRGSCHLQQLPEVFCAKCKTAVQASAWDIDVFSNRWAVTARCHGEVEIAYLPQTERIEDPSFRGIIVFKSKEKKLEDHSNPDRTGRWGR